jgi:hypothetical protein
VDESLMPPLNINHAKTLLQSFPNLFFIGVMLLLSLVISPAFLFLLMAGELSALMIAQTKFVNNLMRSRTERERRKEQERIENQILAGLADTYKKDFQATKQLCLDIENRAGEVETDKSARPLIEGVTDKLSSFRFEYIRMLRAHFLLANRDYKRMQRWLDEESNRIKKAIDAEPSEQVRTTLRQNIKVLSQRAAKVRQLDELVRVIEARLQVVRNSLQLIQDEVYSMADVRGINSIVDELLMNLEINDEFRSYYNDTLSDDSPILTGLDSIEQMGVEQEFTPKPMPAKTDEMRR